MGWKAGQKMKNGLSGIQIIKDLDTKTLKRCGLIPFPQANSVLESMYHFDKEAIHQIIWDLEQEGLIRVVPYKGIEILWEG